MIQIYNSMNFFDEEEIIVDNEGFFNNNVSAKSLSETSLNIMCKIDKARLLDKKTGKIETPYGITSIYDLSTGCKTILNCIFITENPDIYPSIRAINATECGWNAVDELFSFIESNSIQIGVIIEHDNLLYKCKDREYMVNNERRIDTMFDFY